MKTARMVMMIPAHVTLRERYDKDQESPVEGWKLYKSLPISTDLLVADPVEIVDASGNPGTLRFDVHLFRRNIAEFHYLLAPEGTPEDTVVAVARGRWGDDVELFTPQA